MRLADATDAVQIADADAADTVVDDDESGGGSDPGAQPSLSVGDVSLAEGDAGAQDATFTWRSPSRRLRP